MNFISLLRRAVSDRGFKESIMVSGFLTIVERDANNPLKKPIVHLDRVRNFVVDGAKFHAARLYAADVLGYAAHSVYKMKIGSGGSGYTPVHSDVDLQPTIRATRTIADPSPLIITTGGFSVFATASFVCPTDIPVSIPINQEGLFVDDTVPGNSYPLLVEKVFGDINTYSGMTLQFVHEIRFGTV